MFAPVDNILQSESEIQRLKDKQKLLIIDDNKDVIESLSFILGNQFELITCRSYEESEGKIDSTLKVVLLDIKMAYRDGIESFTLLKQKHPHLKIIFHSAYPGSDENAKIAETFPHSGYLTKGNYNISELIESIQKAFSKD